MVKSVIWARMIDYPEHVCTTIFMDGCNFNCEFCYNKNLKNEKPIDFEQIILPQLIERKNFVNHIILSGGECTISPDFFKIVETLYYHQFKIGIHTNGYRPDILQKVISKLDFVGMDIKNDFENYSAISRSQCRCGKNQRIHSTDFRK